MPNTPGSYDKIYKGSEKYGCHYSESIYFPIWQEVIRHIDGRVLEFGCGTGQFAQMIGERKDVRYLGVDYSKEAIAQAKFRNPEMNFLCDDVFKVYVPIVDVIVMLELLEHIKEDTKLISKLPKGKLVIFSVPDFQAVNHYRFFKNAKEIKDRYKHIIFNEIKEFKLIKNKHGATNTIFLCIGRKR
jgi:SAM-dependent methyltransferase